MTLDHKILYDNEHMSEDYASRDYIEPAEKKLLCELKSAGLDRMNMLDMGVGGGRTTKYFAPFAGSYIGADYAPSMINSCIKRYGDKYSFIVCDARDMKCFNNDMFDFVLFSYNGIDSFSHEDRVKALKEIRRVLKRDGILFFSSHNLDWSGLTDIFRLRKKEVKGIGNYAKNIYKVIRLNLLNRSFDMDGHIKKLRRNGRGHIYDNSLNGKAGVYYITRPEQIKQLQSSGFYDISVYGRDGTKDPGKASTDMDGWVYYFCRAK
jgi:ubiquinone/menaquinone biosynthesis C-methylase UbiE